MKLRSLTFCCLAAAVVGLSGCVVAPPYGYVNARVSVPGPAIVVEPAPVVVYPAPYQGYRGRGWGRRHY